MELAAGLALLLSLAQLAHCGSDAEWLRVETLGCLPVALAVQARRVSSRIMCIGTANTKSGLLVSQFDSDTRQCSLFKYIVVCHLINGQASNGINALHSCAAFANARAVSFMTLSRKLMSSVGSKLRAAWVMSDDEEASRSNLVCGETQQWQSESVEFSSEGAKFNGVSSKMWLGGVKFANLKVGLTWLIRLKRVSTREAPLLETCKCDTNTLGASFWNGPPGSWSLYFVRYNLTATEFLSTASWANMYDPNSFVELGGTSASSQSRSFYLTTGFVPQSSVLQGSNFSRLEILDYFCFALGFRNEDARLLNGTVQAVAVMNDTMTEGEIGGFFGLVRRG